MQLLIYLLIVILLSSCTTIEVTKEVVKMSNVVKDKVEEKFEKEEKEIIEDKTIVEEQKIITKKKKEDKTIVEKQQKMSQINFIGKEINDIKNQMGNAELVRSDGLLHTLRYDSKSCRLFLFFELGSNIKRVEYFEFRDSFGELLNTKSSIETCYKEYNLIN